jgi:tripartite-type tricarboxylate transporter receptor subunit TctC
MQASPRRRVLSAIAAVIGLSSLTALPAAHAEKFPAKPVRIIIPFSPGGGADLIARGIAQRLSAAWNETVVPQNIAGAGGNLAAAAAATSEPDGYTLFFATVPIIVSNPVLYKNLPFDVDRDFAPVVLIGEGPHVLVVSSKSKANTVAELIAMAKERPGQLNFGSGGVGTSLHLAGEYFKARTGINIVHVPYKGAAPAITAMLGNEIQMMFDNASSAIGHIRGGRVRGLAIASEKRSPVLADIPTFAESGIPNFRSGVGHSIYVRSGTPAARVQFLNHAINAVLEDPEYRKQMMSIAYNLAGGTPKQLTEHIEAERKKWLPIIRSQNIKVN